MSNAGFKMSLTLAVGITGHRTLADRAAVRLQLDGVFGLIRAALSTPQPGLAAGSQAELRLLSPLAEGADRLFAEAGLAVQGILHCPLPFARDEYLKDFKAPDSQSAFSGLLARAGRVLELDGDPQRRDAAYLEVGRIVVSFSDILVAVWDGESGRGRGGTAEIIAEALKDGLTVVRVDPEGRNPAALLSGSIHEPQWSDIAGLTERIGALLTLPRAVGGRGGPIEFGLTGQAVRGRDDLLDASRAGWAALFPTESDLGAVCTPCVAGAPMETFARADTLANRYAGLYRRAFLANFLLSAFAVTMALLGEQHREILNRVLEFLAIAVIVVLTAIANKRNWHERWIGYRHLAEQLRPIRFLFPMALNLPKSRAGRPIHDDERLNAWADWLVRRIEIDLGFPSAKVDPDYLAAVKDFVIKDILEEQVRYHRRKAARMHRIDHLFHRIGTALFIFTGIACLLDILDLAAPAVWAAGPFIAFVHEVQPVLIFVSGVAPAFGAALLGIRNVGEYDRLERRSSAMAAALDHTRAVLASEDGSRLRRERLTSHLEQIAAQMVSETADWRTLVITRRIEWPG